MKKLFLLLILSATLLGCELNNTPTSKVEELMAKYQSLDADIENEIEEVLSDETLSLEQKNEYKELIRNQYKNLTYDIKDETIDGDNAIVTVEIEVTDYKKAITTIEDKYRGKDDYTIEEYNANKIEELKKVRDKVTYTLDIELTKNSEGDWKLNSLSNIEKKKIQGIY